MTFWVWLSYVIFLVAQILRFLQKPSPGRVKASQKLSVLIKNLMHLVHLILLYLSSPSDINFDYKDS